MAFGKNDARINRNGRPPGSTNKVPNRQNAINLLNRVIEDIEDSFDQLTIDEKIKILQIFKHLFESHYSISETQNPHEIRVNIIHPTNE
jgi:hypothetical protein